MYNREPDVGMRITAKKNPTYGPKLAVMQISGVIGTTIMRIASTIINQTSYFRGRHLGIERPPIFCSSGTLAAVYLCKVCKQIPCSSVKQTNNVPIFGKYNLNE